MLKVVDAKKIKKTLSQLLVSVIAVGALLAPDRPLFLKKKNL